MTTQHAKSNAREGDGVADFAPCCDSADVLVYRAAAPHQLRGELYLACCSWCGKGVPFVSVGPYGENATQQAIAAWNGAIQAQQGAEPVAWYLPYCLPDEAVAYRPTTLDLSDHERYYNTGWNALLRRLAPPSKEAAPQADQPAPFAWFSETVAESCWAEAFTEKKPHDDGDWQPVYLAAKPSDQQGASLEGASVDWPTIVEGLRLADQFFDGDDSHWEWDDGETFPASKVRAAYKAALASKASPDDQRQEGCNMGVGCDEAGVCYAAANGAPEKCGRASPPTEAAAAVGELQEEVWRASLDGELPENIRLLLVRVYARLSPTASAAREGSDA